MKRTNAMRPSNKGTKPISCDSVDNGLSIDWGRKPAKTKLPLQDSKDDLSSNVQQRAMKDQLEERLDHSLINSGGK